MKLQHYTPIPMTANHKSTEIITKIFFIATLFLFIGLVLTKVGTNDDDGYWHIKVGEWIVAHKDVPKTGIFSYTAANLPWVSHEWFSALLMYLVYSLAGWNGLILWVALSIVTTTLLLLNFLLKRTNANTSLIYVLLAYLLLSPHIVPRPHLFALPILIFWTIQLVEASDSKKTPPLALALLMTLWSNMHGGFLIGLAFIVFFSIESIWLAPNKETRHDLSKGWFKFFVLSLIACLITPHGVQGLILPLKLIDQTFLVGVISEWQSPNFQKFQPLEVWLLMLMGITFIKGLRLPFFRLIFLLGLIHMSLKSARFSSDLLSFISPLVIAEPFAKQLKTAPNIALKSLFPKKKSARLLLIMLLMAFIIHLAFRSIETPRAVQIRKVLAELKKDQSALGNVLNSYQYGIYLINEGYPVFIDSRGELYGDKFNKDFAETMYFINGIDGLRQLIDKYHITWTFFETKAPINAFLEIYPGWHRIYKDRYVTIFLTNDREISKDTKNALYKTAHSSLASER
jgi:hypothetical protein